MAAVDVPPEYADGITRLIESLTRHDLALTNGAQSTLSAERALSVVNSILDVQLRQSFSTSSTSSSSPNRTIPLFPDTSEAGPSSSQLRPSPPTAAPLAGPSSPQLTLAQRLSRAHNRNANVNNWLGTVPAPAASPAAAPRPAHPTRAKAERAVRILLNKLAPANFESVSGQVLGWAKRTVDGKEEGGVRLVSELVVEHAMEDAKRAGLYARLSRTLQDGLTGEVSAGGEATGAQKATTAGEVFRKVLVQRCQAEYAATSPAAADATLPAMFSDAYYAQQKLKRRRLGLVDLLAHLHTHALLPARVLHETTISLLASRGDAEVDVEAACRLLAIAGARLDMPDARAHMDAYFERLGGMGGDGRLAGRVRFMCADVVELRGRGWVARALVPAGGKDGAGPGRSGKAEARIRRS